MVAGSFGTDGFEEESIDELQQKLDEHRQSLKGVKKALEISPDQEELVKLVTDLEELVGLYEDMVQMKIKSLDSAKLASPYLTKKSFQRGTETANNWDVPQQAATPAQVPAPENATKSLVGRTCFAPYEGEIYTATINSVDYKTDPPTAAVTYIYWENKEELPLSQLKLIQPPAVSACAVGSGVWGISHQDGLWRPGTIVAREKDGRFKVRLRDVEPVVVLPVDQLSIEMPECCVSPDVIDLKAAKKTREIVTPGGYRIPEALRINPQDSEKVKQVKKRKISYLKKEQRRKVIEEEAQARQNVWKQHTTKKARISRSIFTTTDKPEPKVGVSGINHGLTHHIIRSKPTYEEDDDE